MALKCCLLDTNQISFRSVLRPLCRERLQLFTKIEWRKFFSFAYFNGRYRNIPKGISLSNSPITIYFSHLHRQSIISFIAKLCINITVILALPGNRNFYARRLLVWRSGVPWLRLRQYNDARSSSDKRLPHSLLNGRIPPMARIGQVPIRRWFARCLHHETG